MIRRAALALLLAGCEASLSPCPGTPQGAFLFALEQLPAAGTACGFAGPERPPAFTGVVSWLPASEAALCVRRPLAAPMLGIHAGDAVALSSDQTAVQIADCSCPLEVQETVTGQIRRDGAGAAVGFDGEVVDTLTLSSDPGCAAPGAVCPTLLGADARPSCELRYALTGE